MRGIHLRVIVLEPAALQTRLELLIDVAQKRRIVPR